MARYLIDTSTFIRHARGDQPLSSRLTALARSTHEIGITTMVIVEFFSGLPPGRREEWVRYFQQFVCWLDDEEIASAAGAQRYDLARTGRHLSLPDAMIGAIARREAATVITENLQDFALADVPGLSLSRTEVP